MLEHTITQYAPDPIKISNKRYDGRKSGRTNNTQESSTHAFSHKLSLCFLYKHYRSKHIDEGNKLTIETKFIMQNENTFVTFFS